MKFWLDLQKFFRFCFFTGSWKLTGLSTNLSWTNCLWAFLSISSDIRMSFSTSEGTGVPDDGQYRVSLSSIVKGLQSILHSLDDRSWKTCCTFFGGLLGEASGNSLWSLDGTVESGLPFPFSSTKTELCCQARPAEQFLWIYHNGLGTCYGFHLVNILKGYLCTS